jgi:methyl coenzyme M reductase gamma subunit
MEVREGAAPSRATVQAESIREAVSITRGRYPGRDVRVIFPIDPEDFFIEDPAEGNAWARLSVARSSIDKGKLSGRACIHHFERRSEQDNA